MPPKRVRSGLREETDGLATGLPNGPGPRLFRFRGIWRRREREPCQLGNFLGSVGDQRQVPIASADGVGLFGKFQPSLSHVDLRWAAISPSRHPNAALRPRLLAAQIAGVFAFSARSYCGALRQ